MYYVEFLRVFRSLRIYAIVLAVGFLIVGAVRISAGPAMHKQFMQNFSPTAVRTVSVKDGVQTVTIVDPAKGTHVVQHTGPNGWEMTIYTSPERLHGARRHRVQRDETGILAVNTSVLPDGTQVTRIQSDRRFSFEILMTIAGFFASIFATIVGASLSRENDGHLELVWTKPFSRERSAAAMMLTDACAILLSMGLAALLIMSCIALFVGWPVLIYGPHSGLTLGIALLFPLAWYALSQGVTASLGRNGRVVAALLWLPALVVPVALLIDNPMLRLAFQVIDTLNPVAYFGTHTGGMFSPTVLPDTPIVKLSALAAITIFALAASFVQWRRLEA